jgi:hypothetical protein
MKNTSSKWSNYGTRRDSNRKLRQGSRAGSWIGARTGTGLERTLLLRANYLKNIGKMKTGTVFEYY